MVVAGRAAHAAGAASGARAAATRRQGGGCVHVHDVVLGLLVPCRPPLLGAVLISRVQNSSSSCATRTAASASSSSSSSSASREPRPPLGSSPPGASHPPPPPPPACECSAFPLRALAVLSPSFLVALVFAALHGARFQQFEYLHRSHLILELS